MSETGPGAEEFRAWPVNEPTAEFSKRRIDRLWIPRGSRSRIVDFVAGATLGCSGQKPGGTYQRSVSEHLARRGDV